MTQYIIISGKKASGKTTSAQYIYEQLIASGRFSVKKMSFAEPIKNLCIEILGLNKTQVYGSEDAKNTPTIYMWDKMPEEIRLRYGRPMSEFEVNAWKTRAPDVFRTMNTTVPATGFMTAREVMQIFGTDIFRNFFDKDIWAKVPFREKSHDYIIIDDCRFPNEADEALKNQAILIRLTRNIMIDNHPSENAMDNYPSDKYSYVIDNHDKDITYLYKSIDKILKEKNII